MVCEPTLLHCRTKHTHWRSCWLGLLLFWLAPPAWSELEIYKDYDVGQRLHSVTTIKVDAGKGDIYLEGLRSTWVEPNEVAKQLGHIHDYAIYMSDLPQSGEFNVVLVITYNSAADRQPSKQRYEEFMESWGSARVGRNRKIANDYPQVRDITGEYLMRKVELK